MLNTIKSRLYFAIALFVVAAAVQVAMLWRHALDIIDNSERMTQVLEPTQLALQQLEVNVIQIQQWFTDISATRGLDGLDDGPAKAADNYAAARDRLEELRQRHPKWRSDLQKVSSDLDAYYEAGQVMARAYVDSGPEAGNKIMGQFDLTAERIAKGIHRLAEKESLLQREILATESGNATSLMTLVVGFLLLYLVMATGLLFLFRIVVLKPINFLHEKVSSLNAGTANLAARFRVQGDDEIGHIHVARKIAIVVFSKLAVVGFCSFSIVFPLCHRRKIFTSQIAVGVFTTRRRKTLSHKNRKS